MNVVKYFRNNNIETEVCLNAWLKKDENVLKLKRLRGIGDKTADYFKILSGISTSAVDRHLYAFLKEAGIYVDPKDYHLAQNIINSAADELKIKKSLLDHSIWKYMSSRKKCKTS